MSRFTGVIVVLFLCTHLRGQQLPYTTFLNPAALTVGSGPTTLTLTNQGYTAGLTAYWNGSPRPTAETTAGIGSITLSLTASDLGASQLAQVTVRAPSGVIVDTVSVPVVYNVLPTGVVFDSTRNLAYIATPPKPGDTTFPGNAVVALDVATGEIKSFVPIGNSLGDLALSDDASALYVVDEGDNVVNRIDPSTFTSVGVFNFRPAGTKPQGPIIDAIAVMPGQPDTVALGFSPYSSEPGLSIYDNGVPRANGLTAYSGLLWSPDGQYLFQNGVFRYSQNQYVPSYSVVARYSVDSSGISTANVPYALGTAPSTATTNGLLYTALATTIDYSSMTLTGTFGVGGPIAIDPANSRAYILYLPPALNDEGIGPPPEIVAFAIPTLETLGTQNVGITPITALKDSEKLIRFGATGFIIPSTNGLLIFNTPLAGPSPVTAANAIVNAASQQGGSIAPGEILTIYGTNLGPATPEASAGYQGTFPSSFGNVQVWFDQLPGTLLLAYQDQINVAAPFELDPGTPVNVQVWYYGNPSAQISMPVVSAAPALFTQNSSGSGPVAVVNQDGSINSAAPAGSVVELYGTGGGIAPDAIDGAIAREAEILSGAVTVTIGSQMAQVLYAGAAPGLVNGVFQLNVQVPDNLPSGPAAIVIGVNGQNSPQGATLEIR
jgi:uncharacterized protein (TIGR03437 family)